MSNLTATENHVGGDRRPTVIALHCSGGNGGQWKGLADALASRFAVVAPDLIGCDSTGHWDGARPFSLSEEAARIVRLIDAASSPVHLVGHSYGGAVALRAAYERPGRIASLTLYEPVAFHVLRTAGPEGRIALYDVTAVADHIERALVRGAPWAAAERFVDYWNGAGAWAHLHEKVRAALVRYIPKARLEFDAVLSERTPLAAYGRFDFPMLLLYGEHGPQPTRLVTQQLGRAMRSPAECVPDAGHMGPLTHPDAINALIARNLGGAVFTGAKTAQAARFALPPAA
jgi:pimeloyl-ACP methyl ester carboxylesterase